MATPQMESGDSSKDCLWQVGDCDMTIVAGIYIWYNISIHILPW